MTDEKRIRSLCDEVDLARSIAAELRKECRELESELAEARSTLSDLRAALYSEPLDPPQVSADLDDLWRNQIAYAKDTAPDASAIISARILHLVHGGADVCEALDQVCGDGTFAKLASDLYDRLNARA